MPEQKTLCFFPWVTLGSEYNFGDIRLIPYDLESPPAEFSEIHQDISNIVARYKTTLKHSIRSFTLLTRKEGNPIEFLTSERREDLFTFSEIITYSGLASRRFFHHSGYCNADNFRLVIQNFQNSKSAPSTRSRRRDGSSMRGYADEMFAEHCPHHISVVTGALLDIEVANALYAEFDSDSSNWPRWYESIHGYNKANTDNDAVRESDELVSICGSFEQMMGISSGKENEFVARMAVFLKDHSSCNIGTQKNWNNRYQTSPNVIDAWSKDFFRLRSKLAHGKGATRHSHSTWDISEHLLLASFLHPRLIKEIMSGMNLLTSSSKNQSELRSFLDFTRLDSPFAQESYNFYWSEIESHYRWEAHIEEITDRLRQGKLEE